MKALILGMAGISAVGGAAYMTGGKKPIDDYVGVINRPPGEVYAALAAMGPDGIVQVPVSDAPGAPRMSRRITKEAGKSVRLEVLMDDRTFASIEFQLDPVDSGKTQIAGEVDFDTSVINDAIRARGGQGVPAFGGALAEGFIDRAFSNAMDSAVTQINEGHVSLAALATGPSGFASPGWGSDGTPSFGSSPGSMSARPTWSCRRAVRPSVSVTPQVSVRPAVDTEAAVDPNRAVRDHMSQQREVQQGGW